MTRRIISKQIKKQRNSCGNIRRRNKKTSHIRNHQSP
nr:MAG TPA: hypothetical protein [Crassvirales sp.]